MPSGYGCQFQFLESLDFKFPREASLFFHIFIGLLLFSKCRAFSLPFSWDPFTFPIGY